MADDPNTPGSVPPKSPIQPATPGAPRPITVRLKKPVITPAAAPAAAPAPAAEPAPAATIAPAPVEPAAPAAPAAGGLHAITIPKAKPVMPGGLPSANPIRPAAAPAAPAAAAPAPITPAAAPVQPAPLKPIAVKPAVSQPPVPGSNPLPNGPKPPSEAQVQASKSKTSRISLDSAIGVAPVGAEPKTIRLKRPSGLGTPPAPAPAVAVDKSKTAAIRQTSRIPDSAIPSAEATTTQKKTLKIKRPGPLAAPGADENAEPKADANEGDFANLKPLDFAPPARSGSPVALAIALTAGAIAALIVLGLTFCLGSQAMGPDAGPNALASVKGPILPWTSSK
ncbi:MAG: hypothetical protein IKR48_00590 [Kiritimatiellae bacterium]|nr:hypothetical protein [Kiritimatiellia bacterium]